MPNPWLRLYAEIANDPKVLVLTEALRWRYVALLCLHCNAQYENAPNDEVALSLRVTVEEWIETKEILIKRGLLRDNGSIKGWEKRQFISDIKDSTSAERQKRYRDNKRNARNATVTSRLPDTDTDKSSKPSVSHEKIVFDGSSFQNINGQLAVWNKAFPAVDVKIELAKAEAWLIANPKNRKSNYARFILNWLTKAQDKAPRSASNSSNLFDGVEGYGH